MYEIKSTKVFSKWLYKLKDMRGRIAIARRIERMEHDNFGDVKSVGTNISELRIPTGPGDIESISRKKKKKSLSYW